ncbi:origin recognition complex subunit 3 N-terminus-domain-containing protein [Choanephora cucurbitarum]|nr:origin recognition complex subunit 3 N-terminus-domain-containing protein [Choanephora cucurbitarum]
MSLPSKSKDRVDIEMQDLDEENEEEDLDDEDLIHTPSKCLPYDMRLLEGWYKNTARYYQKQPNLIIILQDFESFEPNVLQDFFTICSNYRQNLPIICIIGIATSTEILHQSLTKATIGLLRIEKFRLELSEVWFKRILERLFLESTDTLKFGARPYKFLLDRFYLYDFSISKVTASLKYALMHQYYGNPLSIFLSLLEKDQQDMQQTVESWLYDDLLNEHHVTHIRMLSSFKSYIESLAQIDPKQALCLLEDDHTLLVQTVPSMLSEIKIYQKQFKLGFNLIVSLQAQFPRFTSFRKSRHLILLESLQTRATTDTDETQKTVHLLANLVRKMDEEHISQLLIEWRKLVDQAAYQDINQPVLEQLSLWEERYQNLMDADDDYTAHGSGGRHTETAKKVQTQSIEHIKKKGTEASKIALSIADWIERTVIHYLRPYNTMPLYEIVYYTNVALHEKSFAPQPRASVQTALTQPQHYINCSCCLIEKSDQILPSEPDACILYKLYLECGRMINLYDWYVAFESFVEREERPVSKKTLLKNEVQARFIRSVAELQFLGFIKPTQRKTDHVIRLTWSNI